MPEKWIRYPLGPFRVVLFKSQGTSIIFTGWESQLSIPQWENLQTVLRLNLYFFFSKQNLSGRKDLQSQTWNSLYTPLEFQTTSCVRMKES